MRETESSMKMKIFLKTVEEADADLAQIYSITESKGELTDDFSLMRIEYNGYSPTEEEYEYSPLKLALNHYNQEEFQEAWKELEKWKIPIRGKHICG